MPCSVGEADIGKASECQGIQAARAQTASSPLGNPVSDPRGFLNPRHSQPTDGSVSHTGKNLFSPAESLDSRYKDRVAPGLDGSLEGRGRSERRSCEGKKHGEEADTRVTLIASTAVVC